LRLLAGNKLITLRQKIIAANGALTGHPDSFKLIC
jgi:hypothetical protein